MSMLRSSSRESYPVILSNATLKSRKRPCGVEMNTPSCTLEIRVRYFSSARLRSVMSLGHGTYPEDFPRNRRKWNLRLENSHEAKGPDRLLRRPRLRKKGRCRSSLHCVAA